MQRLSTQLVPTALTCQPSNRCRTAALTSLRLTLSTVSAYAVLCESGYSDPVVIDAADTDAYVAAAVISQQLSSVLCSCVTGCDANSGFYGKGKKSACDQVVKSSVARRQLSRCGESLDLEKEVVEQLFEFTRHVFYDDNKTSTIAEVRVVKWKRMKNKSFIRLPPDTDSLRQHCLRANYLQQYQGKMGFEVNICSLAIVYKYCCFTYLHTVSMQTPKTHIFPSRSSYVFALPDGGHL